MMLFTYMLHFFVAHLTQRVGSCELKSSLCVHRCLRHLVVIVGNFIFQSTLLNLQNHLEPKFSGMVLRWSPFRIVSDNLLIMSQVIFLEEKRDFQE